MDKLETQIYNSITRKVAKQKDLGQAIASANNACIRILAAHFPFSNITLDEYLEKITTNIKSLVEDLKRGGETNDGATAERRN